MKIESGESASMKIEQGRKTIFNHNRPVGYKIITNDGSTIELTLPAGTELHVTCHGDIKEINTSIYDHPKGPEKVI